MDVFGADNDKLFLHPIDIDTPGALGGEGGRKALSLAHFLKSDIFHI